MILVALGANIPGPAGTPLETLERALQHMEERGLHLERRSKWYQTSPVPASDQPDYINGVASLSTERSADELMAILHDIERMLGRTRKQRWEARALDLDILAYHEMDTLERIKEGAQGLMIPHPRLHLRRFVLVPLAEIASTWCHPTMGMTAEGLLENLTDNDRCEILSNQGA